MTLPSFRRTQFETLLERVAGPRRFIQVLSGPRQVGKTTLVRQVEAAIEAPVHYASADAPGLGDRVWVEAQWERARALTTLDSPTGALLVLDEVQKLPGWSEIVKRLWDEDTAAGTPLQVVILGSAPLLVQRGLTESLAGRFEVVRLPHWSYSEMHDAFGWGLDEYVVHGGYPGAAPLVDEPPRWAGYVTDSLIETTVSRDVLLLSRVDKPALLRQLFRLACEYSGQVVSYQKLVGQLQDAGNTTTLAHYLELLGGAGLVAGLQKYSGAAVRRRGSSPKLVALNNALITAQTGETVEEAKERPDRWGRLVESAVGAHLVNRTGGGPIEVFYWRERNDEVDYVLRRGDSVVGIEVKTGRSRERLPGLDAFMRRFPEASPLVVGPEGVPLEDFVNTPPERWLSSS